MMEKPSGSRQGGMTLIEVLIAIAILGLALVMMLTAISRCLAVLRVSDDYHKAMWALSMGEVEHSLVIRPGETPESFEVTGMEYDGVLFERRVDDPDRDAPDAELRLLLITTSLRWPGRGQDQIMEVAQYISFREE